MIVDRLCRGDYLLDDQARVLELAFLADYSRPFLGLADESAPLDVVDLDANLTAEEIEMHEALMAISALRARHRREGRSARDAAGPVLGGYDSGDVSALVRKLRSAVTSKLYQNVEPGSDAMHLLIGPPNRDASA